MVKDDFDIKKRKFIMMMKNDRYKKKEIEMI